MPQYPFDWQKFHEWKKTVDKKSPIGDIKFEIGKIFWIGDKAYRCVL